MLLNIKDTWRPLRLKRQMKSTLRAASHGDACGHRCGAANAKLQIGLAPDPRQLQRRHATMAPQFQYTRLRSDCSCVRSTNRTACSDRALGLGGCNRSTRCACKTCMHTPPAKTNTRVTRANSSAHMRAVLHRYMCSHSTCQASEQSVLNAIRANHTLRPSCRTTNTLSWRANARSGQPFCPTWSGLAPPAAPSAPAP